MDLTPAHAVGSQLSTFQQAQSLLESHLPAHVAAQAPHHESDARPPEVTAVPSYNMHSICRKRS
jgi:hypothetical protein